MSTITSISNLRVISGAVLALSLVGGCASDPEAQQDDEASTDQALLGNPVNLGTAGSYAILSQTGISTVPPSAITGDMGVSPISATGITGFSLTLDASNVFSTSPQVTGKVYAADYASPTPARLTTAIGDMQHAFTEAAGRDADVTELGGGNLGGLTLSPGVYKWGTSVLIPTSVTLPLTCQNTFLACGPRRLRGRAERRMTLAELLRVRSCAISKIHTSVARPLSVTLVGMRTLVPHL